MKTDKRIVEIDYDPPFHVVFEPGLRRCTVTVGTEVYPNLEVKRQWMGREREYIYTIIVPIAPLPAARYLLAIGRDAIYGYVHPERQPFPEIDDSEPMEVKPKKKSKREKQGQLKLF